MDRAKKQELISTLNELVKSQSFVAVTHYKGLSVKQLEDLRDRAREAGAGYRVVKNRLMRLAVNGTKFEGLSDLLSGPAAIAYSVDPVAAAKVCAEFAKDNDHMVILGGSLDGEMMNESQVQGLSKLPSLDELHSKIISLINAPATKITTSLSASANKLARVINAKSIT